MRVHVSQTLTTLLEEFRKDQYTKAEFKVEKVLYPDSRTHNQLEIIFSITYSSFSDDYRLTAAISIVKWVIQRYENGNTDEKPHSKKEPSSPDQGCGTPKTAPSTRLRDSAKSKAASRTSSRATSNVIPVKALTLALEVCRDFLRCKEHLDIDEPINKVSFLNTFTYSVPISALISVIAVSVATNSFTWL